MVGYLGVVGASRQLLLCEISEDPIVRLGLTPCLEEFGTYTEALLTITCEIQMQCFDSNWPALVFTAKYSCTTSLISFI